MRSKKSIWVGIALLFVALLPFQNCGGGFSSSSSSSNSAESNGLSSQPSGTAAPTDPATSTPQTPTTPAQSNTPPVTPPAPMPPPPPVDPKPCVTGFVKVKAPLPIGTYTSGDFCVMKYEAKYRVTATGQILDHGWRASDVGIKDITQRITGGTPFAKAQAAMPGEVVSVPEGKPIQSTDQEAYSACNSVKGLPTIAFLISDIQWQMLGHQIEMNKLNWSGGDVGAGQLNRGNLDTVGAMTAMVAGPVLTSQPAGPDAPGSAWSDAKRTHYLANGDLIWDISGNAPEWTSNVFMNNDYNGGGTPIVNLPKTRPPQPTTSDLPGLTSRQIFGPYLDYPSASAANNYAGFGINHMVVEYPNPTGPRVWNNFSVMTQRGGDGIFGVIDNEVLGLFIGYPGPPYPIDGFYFGSFRCVYSP